MNFGNGQIVLEEAYEEPTQEEILQYCELIGLDPNAEKDLLHIAREGAKARLPPSWKPVEDTKSGKIYYFNFKTSERTWEHPCDDVCRKMLADERKKRGRAGRGGSKKSGKSKTTPAATEAHMTSEATPGSLNPLSSGRGLAPLGPLRGLPPLKFAPLKSGGLAPVQPPLGMTPPTSFGAPPAANTFTPSTQTLPSAGTSSLTTSQPQHPITRSAQLLNPLGHGKGRGHIAEPSGGRDVGGKKSRDLLGSSELGANLRISTQFVDEDEEDESSDDIQDFRSKLLGQNLLDSRDLGLQEDLKSSEAEDSSEELRRLMQSDEEEVQDGGVGGGRPSAPLGARPPLHTGFSPTGAPLSPVLSPPIPSSLSPLPTATSRPPQTLSSHPTDQKPDTQPNIGAPPTTFSGISTANRRGLPITVGSSITAPPWMKMDTTFSAKTPGLPPNNRGLPTGNSNPSGVIPTSSTAEKLATATVSHIPVTTTIDTGWTNGGARFTVAEVTSSEQGQVALAPSHEEIRAAVKENKQELEKMRQEHEVAVKELKEKLSTELERERETVRREGRAKVEKVRKEGIEEVERVRREGREELERVRIAVEEQRAKEERQLRDRKLKNMSELRKTLKEEEEEEEARLVEEKEDNLRRVRQKIASEKEKEETSLRQEAARSRQELVEKLAAEKHEEEARMRSVASREKSEARAEAEREAETEREEVRKELQRQLQVFREEQDDKHNKEKAEIEENFREQLEALKHEEQLKVQSELERKQSAEEEREKAVQQQQMEIAALQQQLADELEKKHSELQEQHHTTLETVKRELEAALSSAKSEHQRKVEQERERLKAEFESVSTTLRKEHERCVEELKGELATSEEQYKMQVQTQAEKLRELQSDYDRKCSELQQLQQEVVGQLQQVERERRQEEQTRRVHGRGRGQEGKRRDRDNPLLSVVDDPTCSSARAGVLSPSTFLPHSEAATHHQQQHYGGGRNQPDSRERVMPRSHDLKSAEEHSAPSSSEGSMQLDELVPPPASTTHTPNIRANLESVRVMLEQNQRTLLRVLAEEQSMATHEAALLSEGYKEEGEGREFDGDKTRRTEESRRRKRVKSKKRPSTKPHKADNILSTSTVKSKLGEEVKALGELEKKLRSSRQLLFSREQDLRNLHSHLSEDVASDGENGRAQGPQRLRSSADEERESTSDRDRTPTQASRTMRTPQASRPQSRKYPSHSTPNSMRGEGRERKRERDTGHTRSKGTQSRGRETRAEGFRFELSDSGSEGEMSGSTASQSDSPTPSDLTQEDQLESQREMVKSLNSINQQLRQLTSQISQSSPHHIFPPPQPVAALHYPTTPPSARWAEPVSRGTLPTPHLQPRQRRRESGEPKRSRHSQPTSSLRHSLRRGGSCDSHMTTSPTHMSPAQGNIAGDEMLRVNWLQQFQTQFPGFPLHHAGPSLTIPRPLSAPLGPYTVPRAQLVMDGDRNIHLVNM